MVTGWVKCSVRHGLSRTPERSDLVRTNTNISYSITRASHPEEFTVVQHAPRPYRARFWPMVTSTRKRRALRSPCLVETWRLLQLFQSPLISFDFHGSPQNSPRGRILRDCQLPLDPGECRQAIEKYSFSRFNSFSFSAGIECEKPAGKWP